MTTIESMARTTVLVDGTRLQIRPIRADDTDALLAMHRALSSRTVYQRFFTALPELSVAAAERFTHVDGAERFALVAEDPVGRLVAVGRYDRLPPDQQQAEVAVVVADDYQHHGLGTILVTMLRSHARAAGVVDFVADVLMNNRAMRHAFALAGLEAQTSYDHGVAHLVMPLS
ncbi:MAG: CoA-binding protein [Frankiales bacterium]|nr:CoA-binding protein [Frankiales bacterium]